MLTDAKVRNAKPGTKTTRLYDSGGLYLELSPAGGKWWRLKYRYRGRERRMSLGIYRDVSLAMAREKRDAARWLLAKKIDPQRKAEAGTFEAVAREWHAKQTWAPSHAVRVLRRLEKYAFPYLGNVAEIEPPDVLAVVRRLEGRGTGEEAHRVLQIIGQVMRYAVAGGLAKRDPTADLRGALAPATENHFPAVTDPKRIGGLLRMIDAYGGEPTVRSALRIAPYLFVRPGELRQMTWADVDLDAAEWRFTTSKTKTEHMVPLAPQVVEIIEDLRPLTEHTPWVFLGLRGNRPISDMALGAALRRLGIDTRTEHTMHGWRATARTLLHEVLGYAPEVIEHQLAHKVPDRLGGAYNRTKFAEKRREMMQRWAAYLDSLRDGAEVVPLRR
jgi:integrase